MLPSKIMNLPLVLSMDENHDENADLKEFYERNLSALFNCSWDLIPYSIIRKIAVKLDETVTNHEDWRLYATEMGIDNDTISEIKVSAYCHREQEIFFAMDKIVKQRGTFGHIIRALLKTDRFDVLREIESFIRNLLPKIPQRQTVNVAPSVTFKNENYAEGKCTIKKHSASFSEQKCDLNDFQQHSINVHSINVHFKNALQISDSSKLSNENMQEIKVPSAPEEEKFTVLISHSESDSNIAEQLAAEITKQGAIATTLTGVNNLTLYEPVNVLETIFNEVDFIIPVLSNRYMEEIHPQNHDLYLESIYAQNNLKLYTLMKSEYSFNRCVNFRVRPVIVEGMSRKMIKEPIFTFAFRLPNEIPKLIKVLKDSKELGAQQLVQ